MNLFEVYPRYPVEPVSAKGAYVWDAAGRRYLDFYGGHAVISVGHGHRHFVKRVGEQLQRLPFYSNSVINSLQEKLAHKLGEVSGCEGYELFLCNSGAEANENALKLASFGNGGKTVVALEGGFHGRTSAAVAATDNPAVVAPLNAAHSVRRVPMEDAEALETAFQAGDVCAFILEGIQGVGGIVAASDEYLRKATYLCRKHGVSLILDEVQSGYGRSGDFFAYQQAGIAPDLVTIAKGMGNGFPVGGVLIRREAFEARPGLLGTTFGGNHLACAAALAVLEIVESESLTERAGQMGRYLALCLQEAEIPYVELRGRGLMLGLSFGFPVAELRKNLLLKQGLFTGGSSRKDTLRLLPPLTIGKEEIEQAVEALSLETRNLPHETVPQSA